MITVSKFDILLPGDPSVGHFSTTWQLTGPFYFDSIEDIGIFADELRESMASLADDGGATVYAYNETGQQIYG